MFHIETDKACAFWNIFIKLIANSPPLRVTYWKSLSYIFSEKVMFAQCD